METVNKVALLGIAETEVEECAAINGTKVKCQHLVIRTDRHSGTPDYAHVYIPEKATNELLPFTKGLPVMIMGTMQTAKDFKTNRVMAFVAADYAGVVGGEHYELQNEVIIKGKLGKPVQGMTDLSGLLQQQGSWRKEAEEAAKKELKGDI